MKIYSILFLSLAQEKPVVVASAYDFSDISFWARSTAREANVFVAKETMKRVQQGFTQVDHTDKITAFLRRMSTLGIVVVTNPEYPQSAALSLIEESLKLFKESRKDTDWNQATVDITLDIKGLNELLATYQKPETVDKIYAVHKELEATKEVLRVTLEKLVEREGKLQDLLVASSDISFVSKQFLDNSKDLNSCCVIL